MPGIVGCASHKSELGHHVVSVMTEPMLHRSAYRVSEHRSRKFAAATIDLSQNRQNDIATNEKYIVLFFGSLYESWARGNKPAAQILERFTAGGWKQIADLNGEYLIVIWDRSEEKLTIVNDRLGLRRLHYWQGNGIFAFASELKSLAVFEEVSRETDTHALSELLTFGHLQDDRTLLEDVKLLSQASCLTWQAGRLNIHRYWDYAYRADPSLTGARVIDEYYEHTRNAVARRIESLGRIGLFLSGGLDSRTLGGMIRKVNPDIELYTWSAGHGHDHDSRYGRRIAKAINSKHTFVSVPESFLNLYGPEYAWALDGMVTTHGAHRSCLIEQATDKVDLVMLGYMGDTVSGGKPLDYVYEIKEVDQLTGKAFGLALAGFDDALLKKTLKANVYDHVRGLAFDSLRKSIERAQIEFPGDRVVYSELVQRQRLFNPPAQMDLQGLDCYWSTPFTDKDFIDFSLRLPAEERLFKKAYIGMLCKYFPELARIPRSGDGLPLRPSRLQASLHWRWVLFQRNTLPKLTGGLLGGHNYGAFVHCSDWFRKFSADLIRAKLINNPILEDQFKTDELSQFVESFLDGTAPRDFMESIAPLMSYALFRERLLSLPSQSINNVPEIMSL